ncbi:MAG: hypothetical protein HOL17_06200 [Gammaproteobacteria bacterium]|jgi:hypothetical protein|nr:hypothetical protein [Gammaproteobacteria bacterium]MBT4606023.1 hypothetical protein [Thiotrichales bacterium]MBT7829773.1 hypothetical protein [Candidatus Neomarinimicrobiota bacterium]MBT4329537.1 hypothetical protein [Gammaproteobacteria bacterium]MBT5371299.1 hypothetical protein [Gammaproteobacteria bacterium]
MTEYTYRQIKSLVERNPNLFDGLDILNTKRAIKWLPGHMNIFNRFMVEALKAKEAGYQRYSARAIWHYLRHLHQIDLETRDLKLTNIVTPVLARVAMKLDPRLEGLFLLRGKGGETDG